MTKINHETNNRRIAGHNSAREQNFQKSKRINSTSKAVEGLRLARLIVDYSPKARKVLQRVDSGGEPIDEVEFAWINGVYLNPQTGDGRGGSTRAAA